MILTPFTFSSLLNIIFIESLASLSLRFRFVIKDELNQHFYLINISLSVHMIHVVPCEEHRHRDVRQFYSTEDKQWAKIDSSLFQTKGRLILHEGIQASNKSYDVHLHLNFFYRSVISLNYLLLYENIP